MASAARFSGEEGNVGASLGRLSGYHFEPASGRFDLHGSSRSWPGPKSWGSGAKAAKKGPVRALFGRFLRHK